jgi:DMSO/TMAO reductase YedYZ molybdopterin-dependent catalytic subunit
MLKTRTLPVVFLALWIVAACSPPQAPTTKFQVTISTAVVITPTPASCILQPVVTPTRPAKTPASTELDPSAGLHMTGRPQEIDLTSYRLKVTGKVDHPLSLTYDDLRCMPKIQTSDVLICPGDFEDEANWAGASLTYVLNLAGAQATASRLTLVGADEYSTFVTLQQARAGNNYLAYEWEGKPIPIFHGFPVRAVFPSLQGNKWVKWLIEIRVE